MPAKCSGPVCLLAVEQGNALGWKQKKYGGFCSACFHFGHGTAKRGYRPGVDSRVCRNYPACQLKYRSNCDGYCATCWASLGNRPPKRKSEALSGDALTRSRRASWDMLAETEALTAQSSSGKRSVTTQSFCGRARRKVQTPCNVPRTVLKTCEADKQRQVDMVESLSSQTQTSGLPHRVVGPSLEHLRALLVNKHHAWKFFSRVHPSDAENPHNTDSIMQIWELKNWEWKLKKENHKVYVRETGYVLGFRV